MLDAPKAKYPETQILIQRACDNGLKQKEIGKMCRVQQSIVSAWLNGDKTARREQIKPLLEIFGHVGIRKKPSVYLVCEHKGFRINDAVIKALSEFLARTRLELEKTIEERKFGEEILPPYRQPQRITDQELREKFESQISSYEARLSEYDAIRSKYSEHKQLKEIEVIEETLLGLQHKRAESFNSQDEFLALFGHLSRPFRYQLFGDYENLQNDLLAAAHVYVSQTVQIDGPIIFEYTFTREPKDPGPMWDRKDQKIPWMKWTLHELGGGKFCWIVQQPKNTYLPISTQKATC